MNPIEQAQAPEHVIRLTDQDLQIVAQALDNIAFKFAAPLINKISAQLAAEQVVQPQDPTI